MYNTVKATEETTERLSQLQAVKPVKIPEIVGAVVTVRISGFICPACGEVLEAVAVNNVIRGWCSKQKVRVEVRL